MVPKAWRSEWSMMTGTLPYRHPDTGPRYPCLAYRFLPWIRKAGCFRDVSPMPVEGQSAPDRARTVQWASCPANPQSLMAVNRPSLRRHHDAQKPRKTEVSNDRRRCNHGMPKCGRPLMKTERFHPCAMPVPTGFFGSVLHRNLTSDRCIAWLRMRWPLAM